MGVWGRSTTNGSTFNTKFERAMGGLFNPGSNQQLDSVEVYNNDGHSSDTRVAIYTGGTLADPNGATLLEDLGILTGGGAVGWDVISSTTNPTIPDNTNVWIYIHGNHNGDVVASGSSSDAGDFQTARGRASFKDIGTAASTAAPATLGTASFSGFWYALRLNHSAISGGGNLPLLQAIGEA